MDLVVDPAPDGVKLPGTGYTGGSLQDDITISNDKGLIGGHLKYTTGMVTMYPDDRLKQEGNFIALWLHEIGDPYVNYDKIEAKIVDGEEEKELEVSDEGYICFRVNDRATTKLVITVTIGEQTYDAEYKLTGLTVDSYGWNILKGTNPTGEDLYQWGEYVASGDIYSDDSNRKFSIVIGHEDNGVKSAYSMVNGEIDSDNIENEWIKSQFTFTSTSGFSDIGECLIATSFIPLKPNTKYTYSYYEKGTRCPPITVQVNQSDNFGFIKNCFEPVSYNDHEILEDKYTRHEISFTTDEDISEYVFRVGFYVAAESNSQDYTWSIAGLKLEEGDHVTGWDDYWSGDNLLLDTDQPDMKNHNENLVGKTSVYRSFVGGDGSIQFIEDADLPESDMLVNNKYVMTKNEQGFMNLMFNNSGSEDNIVVYDVEDGDPLTISFYVKCSKVTNNNVDFFFQKISDKTQSHIRKVSIDQANKWYKVVYTFIQNKADPYRNVLNTIFVISAANLKEDDAGFVMEVCGVKLEKGAHVTPYRPAPTDFNINYLLDSNLEKTTEAYNFANVYGISSIKDISYNIPVTLTVDGDVGEGKNGFSAYETIYVESKQQVFLGRVPFCGASIFAPPPATNRKGCPFIKNNIFGYVGTYTLTDPALYGTEFLDESSKVVGISIYVPLQTTDGVFSTVHKVKLEVGRYPTKWVDGTGDPAYVPSDEEDDDFEVT